MSSRRRDWCKHYNGMAQNATCKAGVSYEKVKGKPDDCPCFDKQPAGKPVLCELAIYRTPEEIEAEEKLMAERFANIGKARAAIVEELGGPWKRGDLGGSGNIDCPVCGQEGALRFSRAGYNGHIHASCATDGCVGWME